MRLSPDTESGGRLRIVGSFLDIRTIVAKIVAQAAAGSIVVGTSVGLLFSLNLSFFGTAFTFSWATTVASLLVALLLAKPVLDRTQRATDSWFRRRRYDYLRSLENFARYARDVSDIRLLGLTMEQALMLATGASDIRLLVPSGNGLVFAPVSERTPGLSPRLQLDSTSPIVTWLRFHDEWLTRDDLLAESGPLPLTPQELSELDVSRVTMLIPIKHREELAGILALGHKRSGSPYSRDDLELLRSAVSNAAMLISNARLFASVTSQRTRLEQLLGRAVWAREDERKRIALELHDSPVQWLTSAVYRVEACRGFFRKGEDQKARVELDEVHAALNKTLEELRNTSAALHPVGLEKLGLIKALARYADGFERDTGILAQFREHGVVSRLPIPAELAAYRVIQEALCNVRKHSQASEVKLDIGMHNGTLWATVRDNGIGFQVDDVSLTGNGQLGLAGMEERAHMLGGTLGVQSSRETGTQITLLVPYTETSDVLDSTASGRWRGSDKADRRAKVME